MPIVLKNNKTVENTKSSITSIYSARPLAIYRKELIYNNNHYYKDKDKEQSKEECFTIINNAKKRLRSSNNKDNISFQSSKQYLQHKNQLYEQNIFSTNKSNTINENIIPTIKWSNSQFLQNGATTSSSYILKKQQQL